MNRVGGPLPLAGIVLLVEHEHGIADPLQQRLAEVGLRSERATTGREALRLLERTRPGVLLLDLNLPDMYGEAVGSVARERYGAAVPIVVLAAASRQDPRLPPVQAAAVVANPFDLDEVLHLLARFVPLGVRTGVQRQAG